MDNYSDFEEKKVNKVLDYIHYFFLSSIYFIVCNILLTLSLYLFELNFNNLLIFYVSSIFTGPALVALFSFMNKVIYIKYVDTTRDFFTAYKDNFVDTMKFWIPSLTIILILLFDLKLCLSNGKFIYLVFPLILMLCLVIIILLYSLPIISKYKMKIFDLLKLSIYVAIKNPITTIINLFIIMLSFYIFLYSKAILGLFMASLSAFIIMKNLDKIFLFIENKYLK